MTHTALLIAGGALLTSVLAALLFRPTTSPEERHLRDVQRLLRALDAQRRVRDARRRRENRGRASAGASHPPAIVEEQPPQEAKPDRADRRAGEQLRRRETKEQAAALKEQRAVEERAHRVLEQERKAVLKAERASEKQTRRELEQERKAALKAEHARAEPQPARAPASDVADEPEPRPLTELPLYSWATRIETEDRAPTDES